MTVTTRIPINNNVFFIRKNNLISNEKKTYEFNMM